MLLTACLLVLLAAYGAARMAQHVVRTLELDAWDVLVHLGLAEVDAPLRAVDPAPRARRGPRQSRTA